MTLDPTLARLAEACAAAPDRASRRPHLGALRRAAGPARSSVRAAEHLATLRPHGPAAAAEWLGGEPGALGPESWPLARRLVADESVPATPRLAVAGRLLDALPDAEAESVAGPLTAGLSGAKRLQRLRQLARHCEASSGLSALIERAAAATPSRCPRCRLAVPASEFADHLWQEHALVWDGSAGAEPSAELGAAVGSAAAGEVAGLDRALAGAAVFFPGSPPSEVLQAVAAQGPRDPAALEWLTRRAAESGCGVCPNCLAPVPDPVAMPLPPANWGNGRLAAEGYEVAVRDGAWGRRLEVTRPGSAPEVARETSRVPARTRAALIALPAATLGLVGASIAPGVWPLVAAAAGGLVAGGLYRRLGRDPLGSADWEAFDAAWEDLTPGIGRSRAAVRFLTRLTRLSVGLGQAEVRGKRVRELAEHAAVLADRGPEYAALFVAARVLAASDGAAIGLERVAAYRTLFDPVWRGELPARDAELAAELIRTEGVLVAGDEGRLGHLLAADAFAAGLAPGDLALLAGLLPELGRLLPLSALGALYALRQLDYRKVGQPAWELAAADPKAARARLAATPDLVLDAAAPGLDAAVTARGLVVAGVALDPAARLEYGRAARGWALRAGGVTAPLAAELDARTVANLRAAHALAGELAASTPESGLSARGRAAFESLKTACPLCGERSAVRAGRVGVTSPESA